MEPYAHLKTAQELLVGVRGEFKGGYYDAAAAEVPRGAPEGQQLFPAPLQPRRLATWAGPSPWRSVVQAATACLAAPSSSRGDGAMASAPERRAYRASPHRRRRGRPTSTNPGGPRAGPGDRPGEQGLAARARRTAERRGRHGRRAPGRPARCSLRLTEAELYGRVEEAAICRDAPPAPPPEPPAGGSSSGIAEELARRRRQHDAAPLRKGYDGHACRRSRGRPRRIW